MKKKLLAILLCVVLCAATLCAVVACGPKGDDYDYEITMWVGEGTKTFTESLIKKFNDTNEFDVKFKVAVREVSESKATGDVLQKPQSAPEIFCFAQDQLARLVKGKALAAPSSSAIAEITANHEASVLESAKMGGLIYAYPMTTDNAYFLYYDKRVVSDTQAETIEGIIEGCKAYSQEHGVRRNLSMDLSAAWYISSFFYATGCESTWTADEDGKFTDYADTFNSPEGIIALKGMQKVFNSGVYHESDKASDFNTSIKSGAVISGIWDYNEAKTILGDNLGVAKLPTFTVDETPYQLASFMGCKFMGITPQKDAKKAILLSKLVLFLTNEQSQLARYQSFGWRPSNKNALLNTDVAADAVLLKLQASATIPQGQYPADWWSQVEIMAASTETSQDTTAALQIILNTYDNSLSGLVD